MAHRAPIMVKPAVFVSPVFAASIAHGAWVTDPKTGCKITNPNPKPNETITWTGECRNGLAQGLGAVIWYKDGVLGNISVTNFTDGKWGKITKAERLQDLRPIARQGNKAAQYGLGKLYEYGKGVEKDYAEAARWYKKSAEQGYASSEFKMGFAYRRGRGVAKNDGKSIFWYKKRRSPRT